MTLSGVKNGADDTSFRFTYLPSQHPARDDVVSIEVDGTILAIDGRRRYCLGRSCSTHRWAPLPKAIHLIVHRSTPGKPRATLNISDRRGRYSVDVRGDSGRTIFSGIATPLDGIVYVTQATFTDAFRTYAGTSQHNVGNWDDARDAAINFASAQPQLPK